MSLKRPDWSRPLPRPLVIPGVMTLKALADVRKLIGHLPAARKTNHGAMSSLGLMKLRAAAIPLMLPCRYAW